MSLMVSVCMRLPNLSSVFPLQPLETSAGLFLVSIRKLDSSDRVTKVATKDMDSVLFVLNPLELITVPGIECMLKEY